MSNAASRYLSPLRYPGGKGRLAAFVAELLACQPKRPTVYVEPFAGGAGVALRLLLDEYVDEIVLNDLNPGIAAFWRCVFEDSETLLARIATCRPSMKEWHRQHEAYGARTDNDLDLGFATFFLNRTNRSGILDARPIGGLDQRGKWKIGARFNKEELASRIRTLAKYASRVTVCEEDGIDLTARLIKDERSFVYADPPYLVQGDDLYLNTLTWPDHERLAAILRANPTRWFLTYDVDSRVIENLYPGLPCATFDTAHTAGPQHVGSEYAVFAKSLRIPSLQMLGTGGATLVTLVA